MRARLASALLLLTALALAGCAGPVGPTAPAESPATAAGCGYTEAPGGVREVAEPPAEPTVSGELAATIATSAGDIPITLHADAAPCTVGSFVSLVEQGYYDGTECHRMLTEGIFVLQCGDPSATGRGGPGYRYADELTGDETYPAGTIAMANSGPDTNGSQFFLVYEDSPLPPLYTVFATMDAAGTEVVRAVAAAGTANGTGEGPPAETVTLTGVSLD